MKIEVTYKWRWEKWDSCKKNCSNFFINWYYVSVPKPTRCIAWRYSIASNNDVCILISNSGETLELIEIIPHKDGKSQQSLWLGIKSTIANESTAVLEAGVNKEVCPLNLAPTASTAVAMAIGDALAAVWMERKESHQETLQIYPAGSLGKTNNDSCGSYDPQK